MARTLTPKRKAFIEERAKDRKASGAEIARRAGYSPARAKVAAYELMADPNFLKQLNELTQVGLDTLKDVAQNGKVEVARAAAAKTLVETGLGKPRSNDQDTKHIGDITINVHRLEDIPSAVLKDTTTSVITTHANSPASLQQG